MKNNFLLLILFACLLIGISACKKDKGFNSYLRGKIDGVSFECTTGIWATAGRAGDKIIAFRGDWPNHSIRFYLEGQGSNITTGAYTFKAGDMYNATLYVNNEGYGAGYFCGFATPCTFYGSGKITIHEITNNHIKGNFEFITSANVANVTPKNVSDGEFYIARDQ